MRVCPETAGKSPKLPADLNSLLEKPICGVRGCRPASTSWLAWSGTGSSAAKSHVALWSHQLSSRFCRPSSGDLHTLSYSAQRIPWSPWTMGLPSCLCWRQCRSTWGVARAPASGPWTPPSPAAPDLFAHFYTDLSAVTSMRHSGDPPGMLGRCCASLSDPISMPFSTTMTAWGA